MMLLVAPLLMGHTQVSHSGAIGGKAHGNGNNCSAGEIALGVDADGAVEGCYEPVEADITDLSHTAAEVNNLETTDPPNVESGEFYIGTGSGTGAWKTPTDSDITDTLTCSTIDLEAGTVTNIATGEILVGDGAGSAVYIAPGLAAGVAHCQNTDVAGMGGCILGSSDSLVLPQSAGLPTIEGHTKWSAVINVIVIGDGSGTQTFFPGENCTGGNCSIGIDDSIDLEAVTVTNIADTEIMIGDGAASAVFAAISGDATLANDGTFTLANLTKSMWWGAGALSADGTNCAKAVEVTINSGPKLWSIICADNDASIIHGSTVMPDGWDAGTVTFELNYIQTAADTSALNADVKAQCRNATTTVNSTYGSEVAIDDAAVTGSNAIDATTSGAVTADGTCAAGDLLAWQIAIDATGTTTAMATLNILGMKMEWAWNPDDA